MEDFAVRGPAAVGRNRLRFETSPYLLQHADNPVDWYPWSEEAFHKAADENKPIFLSIGYSSCHWCHVMEDESFRDADVANALNRSFVAIKVDREERPDVDQSYMAIAQAVTGQGGWPLTVIMTPNGIPFYLGTYMPRQSVTGQVGLMQLLPYVAGRWADPAQREAMIRSGGNIVEAMHAAARPGGVPGAFPETAAVRAYSELAASFDSTYGGFGDAPKFPTPVRLRFLLEYWRSSHAADALSMVTGTLDGMRSGGIYDHLDSGFHRYSVDRQWAVPHFEKMLYDQSLLADAYLDAYMITGKPLYSKTVADTLGYVLRHLTSPDGAFYCSEDADSAEGEGAYYVWTLKQLRAVLEPVDLRILLAFMGIELDADGQLENATIREDRPFVLALINAATTVAEALSLSPADVEASWRRSRTLLLEARRLRQPVRVDDKVLADWNGLAISALARAGRVLGRPEFVDSARRAADFVLGAMVRADGVLVHAYKNGAGSTPGFLEDYASMAIGLLELYQASHQLSYLRSAVHLADEMVAQFWDEEDGGFRQTGKHGEELVLNVKSVYDGALPSGNAMAAMALSWVARLMERADLNAIAGRLFDTFGLAVESMPSQYTSLIMAHTLYASDAPVTVIVGEADSPDTAALLRAADTVYAPTQFVILLPAGPGRRVVEELLPVARDHESGTGGSVAFVCTRSMCNEPAAEPTTLRKLIE